MRVALAACVLGWAFASPAQAQDLRIDALGGRAPDRVLVFVVRGDEVRTPIVAFQDVARDVVERHMFARVLSMEEVFVQAGASIQKKLADCRGEPQCYARLVGSVDANYLLVVAAVLAGEDVVVGAKFIDLDQASAIGNSVGSVAANVDPVESLPDRIREAVPKALWEPFGRLEIECSEQGAEIAVNGRAVGLAPVGRVGHLMPGSYRVSAIKPGFQRAEQAVEVAQAEVAKVQLELRREETASLWWLWLALGVAAAGGATAAILVGTRGEPSFCSSPDPGACP